jgi:molecular chaperone GrpE
MSKQNVEENQETEQVLPEDPVEGKIEGKKEDQPETGGADNAAPSEAAGEKAETSPEEKIAALEAQVEEFQGQYLRKAADFENFRKRMNREKQEAIDFANQSLLLDLVQIIDDFERAIKAAEGSREFSAFLEGITMIEKRLSSQLENKWGLTRFDSEGEPFDPNRHEAIMMEKSADVSEPVVKEDFIKGYTLKNRVIRSAKVKVLMPEPPEKAGGAEGREDSEGITQAGSQEDSG